MALSTVVAVTVSYFVLLHACCVVANGNGRGSPPGHNKDQCSECCDKILVLVTVLEGVVSKLDKQAQDLDEVKSEITKSIPLQLEKQTLAIEELKAAFPRGVNNSQFEKQAVALEELKAAVVGIASQLERQTLLQERQSVAIGNVTSQLRKQDRDLVEVKAAVANVFVEGRKLAEDLTVHDYRLVEHDELEKSDRGLVKEIYDALLGPRDCSDVATSGRNTSSVYRILTGNINGRREIDVFCDFSTPGGGWLVFQRRKDGTVNFERTWSEYESGFGEPSGEFWLGNQMLHLLTSSRKYKLRIELEDFEGQKRFAEYTTFFVASAADYYRLTVDGYSGDAGDSLSTHSGKKFSTKDVDNDQSLENCALRFRGAWWYGNCLTSDLNGAYLAGPHKTYADGIVWNAWHGFYYSLKTTEMKIAALD